MADNQQELCMVETQKTIPVTVLTGFLGAGKTTILNRILQDEHFRNSLVLVNEFGEVGIDHLLIENLMDDVVLLKSGCVCCTLRGEMAVVLLDLAAQRDAEILPPFDHVILETTGLADPAPIMQILMTDPLLLESYHLGRVVTVVDSIHGLKTMAQHKESRHQVAVADSLLLSKTDLAEQDKVTLLKEKLSNLNPGAEIISPVAGNLDLQALIGDGRADTGATLLAKEQNPDANQPPTSTTKSCCHHEQSHDHGTDCDHKHCDHDHDSHAHSHEGASGIQTFVVPFAQAPERGPLLAALARLSQQHSENLLRYKGLIQFKGEITPTLIQGVQDMMHPPVSLPCWPDGLKQSGLVFIVDGLPSNAIVEALKQRQD